MPDIWKWIKIVFLCILFLCVKLDSDSPRDVLATVGHSVGAPRDFEGDAHFTDIVVVVDESGSMDTEHSWLQGPDNGSVMVVLDRALYAAGVQDVRFGLTGFPSETPARGFDVGETGQLFGTSLEFEQAALDLTLWGGWTEDGYCALQFVFDVYPFTSGPRKNVILITDEDRDVLQSFPECEPLDFDIVRSNLETAGIVLNAIVDCSFTTAGGDSALGVALDESGEEVAYVEDGVGGFVTVPGPVDKLGFGSTVADYVDLALKLGGAAWDLNKLREGAFSAESFTNAFIDVKVKEITSYMPDLVVSALSWTPVSDAKEDMEITFTATIENSGTFALEAPFDVDFRIDNASCGSQTVHQLMEPGDFVQVSQIWLAKAGDHSISAIADSGEAILEIDEENNARMEHFSVEERECAYALDPTSRSFPIEGGTGEVAVTAADGCPWTATSEDDWINVASGNSGTGNGTVTYAVGASESTASRTGGLSIAGHSFTVTQAGPGCSYAIDPTSDSFPVEGGSGVVSVAAGVGCEWTAASDNAWISVTSASSGTGDDSVSYSVQSNEGGDPRTGTLTIAGRTFTVSQDGRITIPASERAALTDLYNATGGADWTNNSGGWVGFAGDKCDWFGVTCDAAGSAVVKLDLHDNNLVGVLPATLGSLTHLKELILHTNRLSGTVSAVGSLSAIVEGPTLRAKPSTGTAPSGGLKSFDRRALRSIPPEIGNLSDLERLDLANNRLTGEVPESLLSLTSLRDSDGLDLRWNGLYTDDDALRDFLDTKQVGGEWESTQIICNHGLTPTSASLPSEGGSGGIEVAGPSECAWTAASNDDWITVTAGTSGTGYGTVDYFAEANDGPGLREGSLSVAGRVFTVSQAGDGEPGCIYSLSPTSGSFSTEGGTGTIQVGTPDGCPWTATSNDDWISIAAGTSGTGTGAVTYAVASNDGAASRGGSLSVGGRVFTVSQEGTTDPGCTYALAPTSQVFPVEGGTAEVAVSAAAGCSWTATSNDAWISVVSGESGSGSGTVGYSAEANEAPEGRTGTLTVAGRTFPVSQAGTDPSSSPHTISATAGRGGTISPSGDLTVFHSTDLTFAVTPQEGYRIAEVVVDGVGEGAVTEYTFESIAADHAIHAVFQYEPGSGEEDGGDDDTPARSTPLVVDGRPQRHDFEKRGDEDWFKFYGLADMEYTITVDNLEERSDPVVEVYQGETGSLVAASLGDSRAREGAQARQGESDEERAIEVVPPEDGVYYVRVRNSDPEVFGEATHYDIALTTRYAPDKSARLLGAVLDGVSGEALGDAVVRTASAAPQLSFPGGDYVLPHEAGGPFALTAEKAGYEIYEASVSLLEGETKVHDIFMTPLEEFADVEDAACRIGGSETGWLQAVTVDTEQCPTLALLLGRRPAADTRGRLYVALEAPGVPALADYLFFRPSDAVVPLPGGGGFVRLVKDGNGFFPDAEEYFFYEGSLTSFAPDLCFLVGSRGLSGLDAVFETSCLPEGSTFGEGTLEVIQRLEVSFR